MKRQIILSVIFILVFFIYFLFSPVKIYKADNYLLDNFFYIDNAVKSIEAEDINGYFSDKHVCGYFSADKGMAGIKYTEGSEYITANKYFYVRYKKVGGSKDLFLPSGEKIKSIDIPGYPYISGEHPVFYVLKTNGMGFSLYSIKGEAMIPDMNYTSVITSISTDEGINTLVSTIDGNSYLYGPGGERLFNVQYSGEGIKISKSNALEKKGNYFSIRSGIGPESIEIYKKQKWQRIKSFKTESDLNYGSFMRFVGNRLYFEGENEICSYNIKNGKKTKIVLGGQLSEIDFDQKGNMMVSTHDDKYYYLNIYTPNGQKKLYKEFVREISDLKFINNDIFYFKLDNIIFKMKLRNS